MKKVWTIWKYAIGSFSDEKTAEYDNYVAVIRTLVVFVNFVTCFYYGKRNTQLVRYERI